MLDDLSPGSVCSNTFLVPTCWKVSVEAWKPALSWSRLPNICEKEYSTMETYNMGCFLKGWCHLRAKSKWWRTDDNRFSASSLPELILWLPLLWPRPIQTLTSSPYMQHLHEQIISTPGWTISRSSLKYLSGGICMSHFCPSDSRCRQWCHKRSLIHVWTEIICNMLFL